MGKKKGAEVHELWQEILDKGLLGDLIFDPEFVDKLFVSNLIQRSMSQLFAVHSGTLKKVICDGSGRLLIATEQSSPNLYDVQDFANISTLQTITPAATCYRIDIRAITGDAIIRFSHDGTVWGDYIDIVDSDFRSIDIEFVKYGINKDSANFTGQVVSYYRG